MSNLLTTRPFSLLNFLSVVILSGNCYADQFHDELVDGDFPSSNPSLEFTFSAIEGSNTLLGDTTVRRTLGSDSLFEDDDAFNLFIPDGLELTDARLKVIQTTVGESFPNFSLFHLSVGGSQAVFGLNEDVTFFSIPVVAEGGVVEISTPRLRGLVPVVIEASGFSFNSTPALVIDTSFVYEWEFDVVQAVPEPGATSLILIAMLGSASRCRPFS